MEHLRRNTNNDRLVYTIEKLKKESNDTISQEIKQLADKVVNVITGILSSVVAAALGGILEDTKIVNYNAVVTLLMFIALFFGIWFIFNMVVVPFFYKKFYKEIVDITPERENVVVRRFHTEIMQKVSEVDEVLDVIATTDMIECKRLNFVISLYKFQEIVNFMYNKLVGHENIIRCSKEDSSVEFIRYSFNIYTVSAVLETMHHMREKMHNLLKNEQALKELDGYDLMLKDFEKISEKLEKIKI